MIWRSALQSLLLWIGWFLATWIRDMFHYSEKNELETVRTPHDIRPEEPISAREPLFVVMGYWLFFEQLKALLRTVVSRNRLVAGRMTLAMLLCLVPMTIVVNLVLPDVQRGHVRMHRKMIQDLKRQGASILIIPTEQMRPKKAA